MKNLDELVLSFRYLEIDTSPKLPKFKDGERLLREKTIEGFERLGYDKKGIEYKDRLEYELDNIIRLRSFGYIYFKNNILISKRDISDICSISKSEWNKLIERRIKLDQKRKEIRIKRKLNGKS